MVDRYALTVPVHILKKTFDVEVPASYQPFYNGAPTRSLPVSTLDDPKNVQFFHWGLIATFSNNKKLSPRLFNTDFQQTLGKPSLSRQLLKNRCVIYASGFYLWKPISKKGISPYYFHYGDTEVFPIAGIWENYESMEGTRHNAFQMITTQSPDALSSYQDDLPLILSKDHGRKWMDAEASLEDLSLFYTDSASTEFQIHSVSPAIRDIHVDSPKLIEPIKPADQHGNYTLFG